MGKKIMAIPLVLVLALSFTACEKEPSEQEIIDGVIESFENIKTYQFELDMTMNANGEVGGEAIEQNMTMDNSGTFDLENLQMKTYLSAGSGDEISRVESYVIDGMVYARPEAPGEEPMWIKSEAPAEYWEMMKGVSGLENYKELLQTAEVKILGSEKVNGVDCYELELTPEMAKLYQAAMIPVGGGGQAGILPTIPEELIQDIFSSFSVKQWVAKDNYFLMKTEINMTIESTPELMDYMGEEGDVSIDVTIIFLAYNYNQPVSIELPPEAENASEM